MIERIDAMFASGECPDAIIVFVDAWTSFGGSQFLNSTGTGRYLDYLCDELVGVRRRALPDARRRATTAGLTGKSSGGYGAMVVPMLRPDVFGALATHAGDALFEACYLPEFPVRARQLRDEFDGSWDAFFERPADRRPAEVGVDRAARAYGYAAGLLARPGQPGPGADPVRRQRPADRRTSGRSGWRRTRCGWRRATRTRCARCAASTSTPGNSDEYFLDLGAQAFAAELDKLGVAAHARALRRHARAADVPLPGRDPGARHGFGRERRGAVARPRLDRGPGAVARVRVDVALAGQAGRWAGRGRRSPRPPGSTDRCRRTRAARCSARRPARGRTARARPGTPARDGGATSSTRSAGRPPRATWCSHSTQARLWQTTTGGSPNASSSRSSASSHASSCGLSASGRSGKRTERVGGAQPAGQPGLPVAGAGALIAVQDQICGAPHAGRYRSRRDPLARRQRPPLPDDVGADEAGARAAARRARRWRSRCPPGRRWRTSRARRARPATLWASTARRSGSCAHERGVAARVLPGAPVGGRAPRRAPSRSRRRRPRRRRAAARRRPRSSATRASSCCPEWTEEAQIALRDASVLVVGAGALGSPVALYLAGAGVGRLGIVDDDVVEISNLHRQPLHFTPDLGVPKVSRRRPSCAS